MLRIRSLLPKAKKHLPVSHIHRFQFFSSLENEADKTVTRVKLVKQSIGDIHELLSFPRYNMINALLRNVNELADFNTKIPISYCMEAINILAKRRDVVAMGKLMTIVTDNYGKGSAESNKVVFHCIGQMIVNGNAEEAAEIIRSGVPARQQDYFSLFDLIVKSKSMLLPIPAWIVDFLHSRVAQEQWNQSHDYYVKLLQSYHCVLSSSKHSIATVLRISRTLEDRWEEVLALSSTPNVELLAARTLCLVAMTRQMRITTKNSPDRCLVGKFADLSRESYEQLLERSSKLDNRVSASGELSGDNIVHRLTREMKTILSDVTSGGGPSAAGAAAVSDEAVVDTKKMRKLISNYFDPQLETASAQHAAPTIPLDFLRSTGLMRSAALDFPIEIAKLGRLDDALKAFDEYVSASSQQRPRSSSNESSKYKLEVNPLIEDKTVRGGEVSKVGNNGNSSSSSSNTNKGSKKKAVPEVLNNLSLKTTLGAASVTLNSHSLNEVLLNRLHATPASVAASEEMLMRKREDDWFEYLMCSILKHYQSSIASPINKVGGDNADRLLIEDLHRVLDKCESMCRQHSIPLGVSFYSCFIYAVGYNAELLNRAAQKNGQVSAVEWEPVLRAVQEVIASLPSEVGQSSVLYHAQIGLLCRFREPPALLHAMKLIEQMSSQGVDLMPESLAEVLRCGYQCLTCEDLTKVVDEVEYLLYRRVTNAATSSLECNLLTLEARILCHCQTQRGFHALTLFRRYKALGGKVRPRMYAVLLKSLVTSPRVKRCDYNLMREPEALTLWLMKEMKLDGIPFDNTAMNRMLRIFSRHLAVCNRKNSIKRGMDMMEEYVEKCSNGDLPGTPVDLDSTGLAILIRSYLQCGHPEKAHELFDNYSTYFPLLKLGPEPCEAFMYHYAVVEHNVELCEELMELMEREGIAPTDAIVSSLVLCYLHFKRPHDALEHLLDLHAQHQLRPSAVTILRLLDYSLQGGDQEEARRVADVICHLYSPSERASMLGSHSDSYLSESPSHSDYEEPEGLIDYDIYRRVREELRERGEFFGDEAEEGEEVEESSGSRKRSYSNGDVEDSDEEEHESEGEDEQEDDYYDEEEDEDVVSESKYKLRRSPTSKVRDSVGDQPQHYEKKVDRVNSDATVMRENGVTAGVESDGRSPEDLLGLDGDDLFNDIISHRAGAIKKAAQDRQSRIKERQSLNFKRTLANKSEEQIQEWQAKQRLADQKLFQSRGWIARSPAVKAVRLEREPHLPHVRGVLSDKHLEARFRKYGLKLFD